MTAPALARPEPAEQVDVPCPQCAGAGELLISGDPRSDNADHAECPVCHGLGVLTVDQLAALPDWCNGLTTGGNTCGHTATCFDCRWS